MRNSIVNNKHLVSWVFSVSIIVMIALIFYWSTSTIKPIVEKQLIIALEEQAKDLVEGIKVKYKTLTELEDISFGEIITRITKRTKENE